MLAKLDTKTFVSNKANVKSSLANIMCVVKTHLSSLDPNKPENYK